jgi:hypothetical protein
VGHRFDRDLPGWLDKAIGGWDLGGILVWQNGAPFTVSSPYATTWGGTTYANYTGDRKIGNVQKSGDGVWYFISAESANFSSPGAGEVGTSGRNSFRSPGCFNIDVPVVKRFRIAEGYNLSFRAEGYNVLNHANFSAPSTSLTSPTTFGKISSVLGAPRYVQVAVRYDF